MSCEVCLARRCRSYYGYHLLFHLCKGKDLIPKRQIFLSFFFLNLEKVLIDYLLSNNLLMKQSMKLQQNFKQGLSILIMQILLVMLLVVLEL